MEFLKIRRIEEFRNYKFSNSYKKKDNLASGKGVYVCSNQNESSKAVDEIFDGKFGKAESLLIEEFLIGEEMSYFTIHDGISYKNFSTAQDHKELKKVIKVKTGNGRILLLG